MVWLANERWSAPQIAAHFQQNGTAVVEVLKRFVAEGIPELVYRKPPGAKVSLEVGKGTVLGHIISPYTFEKLETFRAPFSRSLVTLVASPYVRIHPGDFAYMIVDAGSL